MEDITLRALRVLREVSLIAAEDTRKTRGLLERHGIKTRLTSFHDHSGVAKLSQLVDHMMSEDLALVSDAGMPSINDPGHELIAAAITNSVPVVPIPGATAVITALVASGASDLPIHLRRVSAEKEFGTEEASILGVRRGAHYRRLRDSSPDSSCTGRHRHGSPRCGDRGMPRAYQAARRGVPGLSLRGTGPLHQPSRRVHPRHRAKTPTRHKYHRRELRSAFQRLESEGVSGREAVDKVAHAVGRNRVYRVWVGSGEVEKHGRHETRPYETLA